MSDTVSTLPVLVLEVGGTSMRAGRFDAGTCRLLDRRTLATPAAAVSGGGDPHAPVLQALDTLAHQVAGGSPRGIVVLAYAGPVDAGGSVLAAPTVLRGSGGAPLALRQRGTEMWPGADVRVLNDLTAAGYRYVGAGLRDFAIVTVGSGIGHKVFLDARPLVGPAGRGGEIGHLRLDLAADALLCDCGGRGHLGGLSSGRGTVALTRRHAVRAPEAFAASRLAGLVGQAHAIDAPAVVAAYLSDDDFTSASVGEAVGYLGQALAALHLGTGVEQFVIVGGFALALGERYRAQLVAAAARSSWAIGQDWDAMLRLGEPDDDSGLIGAGLFGAGLVGATGPRATC